ncbi:MAG: hypothetical protein H5U05_06985 [Candidatus Aminicenantes bacterium]|nr:hypothetical protein [Candidatus Aminicenantes bacterium]
MRQFKGLFLPLIVISLGIISGFILSKYRNNLYAKKFYLPSFPDRLFNIGTNKYEIPNFKNDFIYLQLLRSNNENDVTFFSKLINNFDAENLKLIIVSDNPSIIKKIPNSPNFYFADFNELSSQDKKKLYDMQYYIFGPGYKLLTAGNTLENYEYTVKIYLMQFIKNISFKVDEILSGKNIFDLKHFNLLKSIVEHSPRDYFMVALFTDFCDSCNTGYLIKKLDNISKYNEIEVIGILYSNYYSYQQLNALISQSNLSFPVILSDDNLNMEWDKLIKRYNDKLLNNIIFVTDRKGNILKAFQPSITDWNEFEGFVLDHIRRKKI